MSDRKLCQNIVVHMTNPAKDKTNTGLFFQTHEQRNKRKKINLISTYNVQYK